MPTNNIQTAYINGRDAENEKLREELKLAKETIKSLNGELCAYKEVIRLMIEGLKSYE